VQMELARHTPAIDFASETRAALEHFRLARYRFRLEASTPLALPPYEGFTFRGALGHALKGLGASLTKTNATPVCCGCGVSTTTCSKAAHRKALGHSHS